MTREREKYSHTVTPAKAGVQKVLKGLDSGFRRNDDLAQEFKGIGQGKVL